MDTTSWMTGLVVQVLKITKMCLKIYLQGLCKAIKEITKIICLLLILEFHVGHWCNLNFTFA